ncbi:MAG: FMN-binding negative transcriptional regulator [Pararhizobium sp.]
MYVPKQFREVRRDVLIAAMRDIQLCTLVTAAHAGGIEATHVPAVLSDDGALTLECHVARGNPHWRAADGTSETLAIFQGPHAYVSPNWYASKREHGKVVPTWNYVVVHARGRLQAFDDPDAVLAHVTRLTAQNEAGRSAPWAVSDAPADYLDTMRKAIVGMRMTIDRLEGSWKLIQHKPEADRLGTIAGLAGEVADNSRAIAKLMQTAEEARR